MMPGEEVVHPWRLGAGSQPGPRNSFREWTAYRKSLQANFLRRAPSGRTLPEADSAREEL